MGQLPTNEIPENRAHLMQGLAQQETKKAGKEEKGSEKGVFVSIIKEDAGDFGAALVGETREEYEQEMDSDNDIIFHEQMFGKPESEYNTGEGVIAAIARTAGLGDEPGTALENLVKQVFLLGVAHGITTERARIQERILG